jgi:hypothetical protein
MGSIRRSAGLDKVGVQSVLGVPQENILLKQNRRGEFSPPADHDSTANHCTIKCRPYTRLACHRRTEMASTPGGSIEPRTIRA